MKLSVILLHAVIGSLLPLHASSQCERLLEQGFGGGSFIHGSISWRRVSMYTVEFEVMSTWRRKFAWPCNQQGFSGRDGWPAPGDRVLTAGLGYKEDQSQGETVGISFETGDGARYPFWMRVDSISVEEDWMMGTFRMNHTYQRGYESSSFFYPKNFAYTIIPQRTVPWTARLAGCCRYNYSGSFAIESQVDLSSFNASFRIVTMPVVFAPVEASTRASTICFIPRSGMVSRSGGTVGYPLDDYVYQNASWSLVGSYAGQVGLLYNRSAMGEYCVGLEVQPGTGMAVTVMLSVGNLNSTCELQVRAASASSRLPSNTTLRCWSEECASHMEVFFGYDFPRLYPGEIARAMADMYAENKDGKPLEVRYRFASKELASAVVSSDSRAVESVYSWNLSEAGLHSSFTLNHFSTPEDTYVTDIHVLYSQAVDQAQLPLYGSLSSASPTPGEYTVNVTSVFTTFPANVLVLSPDPSSQSSHGWSFMYYKTLLRLTKLSMSTDAYELRAITDIRLVNSSKEAEPLLREGYVMLGENLLGPGSVGEIYLLYKRGTDPPIIDVSISNISGYSAVEASSYLPAVGANSTETEYRVVLYYLKKPLSSLSMSFLWTPCEADVGVYVICAQLVDSLSGGGGRTQCTSVTVGRAPAPYTEALPVQVATMGEEQRIVFTVARQDQGFAEYYRLPSIRLSRILGNVPSRVGNLTTFEPLHAVVEMRVNGATTMTLSNVSVFENKTRLDGSRYSFQGLYNGSIVWTPSHQLSGWQGAMCLTTCVYPLTCRGWSGERRAECSEYCIPVRVERCKWYVSRAQTYTEIAGLFSTSSLLLWYMNPVRQSSLHYDNLASLPSNLLIDFPFYPGETINVGRLFHSTGKNVSHVAALFSIGTSDILRMNVDLNSSVLNSDKQLNQDLCIVPNICIFK